MESRDAADFTVETITAVKDDALVHRAQDRHGERVRQCGAVPVGEFGGKQQDSLFPGKPARGALVLEFLRGNRLNEGVRVHQFRVRGNVLGDIVDSSPVYVGKPSLPYRDSDDPGYSTFKSALAGRAARVYVGANEGMFHAFDDATGNETWAYIPSVLYRGGTAGGDPKAGLGALAYQDGALPPFKHHFFVDSTARITDVDFGSEDWHTIAVGGLGKGGKMYYALDVTQPADVTTEAAAAGKVLWEFTDPDMGYSYGKPMIAKTRAFGGAWLVVVASGYNNASGNGNLYFIRASDGHLLKKMSTGAGSPGTPSGLAHPAGYTRDFRNQLAEQVYAGDLLGNFWRFDVSDVNDANWTVGKLGNLVDNGGIAQPVTTPPQIEVDITNGIDRWVFVGTGKLYDDSDTGSTQIETMYAFRDGTATNPWPLPDACARSLHGGCRSAVACGDAQLRDRDQTGQGLVRRPAGRPADHRSGPGRTVDRRLHRYVAADRSVSDRLAGECLCARVLQRPVAAAGEPAWRCRGEHRSRRRRRRSRLRRIGNRCRLDAGHPPGNYARYHRPGHLHQAEARRPDAGTPHVVAPARPVSATHRSGKAAPCKRGGFFFGAPANQDDG